jgi:hypothetical protein
MDFAKKKTVTIGSDITKATLGLYDYDVFIVLYKNRTNDGYDRSFLCVIAPLFHFN